ncbi:hypothetical protein HJC99_05925 [Candidatus Saccharibacteria bacterium]|nr:hypothetical protein [Candidatus Saccharibacteria bacterium]
MTSILAPQYPGCLATKTATGYNVAFVDPHTSGLCVADVIPFHSVGAQHVLIGTSLRCNIGHASRRGGQSFIIASHAGDVRLMLSSSSLSVPSGRFPPLGLPSSA